MPTESQRDVIQTRLQSDDPPDVFTYDTGPGFGGVLAEAGLLRSLEDAYKEKGWDIYDWAKQRATYNGTVYGVPVQVEEIVVYYNKSLVPEPPTTVDELRQISDDLKGQDIIPFSFGDQEQWPAGHIFSVGASNVLGREGLDNIFYGDGRWDSPEVVAAIDLMFRQFVENGYYPDGVNAITYDDANNLFYSGQAAMNPTGTWLVSTIVESVQDFEVGFFPFPSIDGSSISPPAGVGAGYFVPKNAKNQEGAITFIDYLLQNDTERLAMEKFNTIPAHPVPTGGLDVPELFKQVLADLALLGLMFPFFSVVIPLFYELRDLGLLGTKAGVILVLIAGAGGFGVPIGVFLMRSFYMDLPEELADAARVDGATEFQVFRSIMLPLSGPGVAVLAVLVFFQTWNVFAVPLLFLPGSENQVLATGLYLFASGRTQEYEYIAAGSLIMVVPVVVFFLIFQRMFVRGLTAGALK